MANIRVVLELDNRKYIAEVKRAEDATNKFANKTQQGLRKVTPSAEKLNASFAKLGTVIASIGISAFVRNAIRTADAFNNLSNATGMSLESIIGFSNALVAAGGSSDKARDGISDLVKNIGEARAGSIEMQRNFARVGVTLRDLENPKVAVIQRQIIKNLAEMSDKARATSSGMKLMGESIKGIDLSSVNNNLNAFVARAGAQADASRSAAAANTNLAVAFTQLQEKVLIAIKPITDFIASLSPEQIDQITTGIVDLAKALATIAPALAALRSIAVVFASVGGALALSKSGLLQVGTASAGAATAMGRMGKVADMTKNTLGRFSRGTPIFSKDLPQVTRFSRLLTSLSGMAAKAGANFGNLGYSVGLAAAGFVKLIPGIAQAGLLLIIFNEAIDALTGKNIMGWIDSFAGSLEDFVRNKAPAFANALDALGAKLGMSPPPSQQRFNEEEIRRIDALVKKLKEEARAREDAKAAQATVVTELGKFAQQQSKITEDLALANQRVRERIGLEAQLVGLSSDEQEIQTARAEALNRQLAVIQNLQSQAKQLQANLDPNDEIAAGKIGILNQQIALIRERNAAEAAAVEAAIRGKQNEEALLRIQIQSFQELVALEDLRASILGFSLTEQEKFNRARAGGIDFVNLTKQEVDQLEEQARALDAATGGLNAQLIARELNSSLLELETQLLGRQFSALEKLEQLKNANPQAFSRKTADEIAALTAQAAKIDEVTEKFRAQAFARDLLQQGEDFTQGIRDEMSLQLASGEATRRRIQIEIDGRTSLQTKIREINQSYGDELNLSESLRQQRAREISEATAGITKLQALKARAVAEDQAQRDSFEFGFESAFSKFAEDAQSAANQATTAFQTFTRGFENAFVKFVQTGKISFKDLANSIIADFARIQAKKLLVGLFGGGGGGGGNFLSSLFGGFFANGGNPPMGKVSIVGERGPEAFIPRNAGTIVPLQNLGGGGNNTSVTYNISAVDASSFQQLIARDPKFLHAVVEKGRRSLPQGARQ